MLHLSNKTLSIHIKVRSDFSIRRTLTNRSKIDSLTEYDSVDNGCVSVRHIGLVSVQSSVPRYSIRTSTGYRAAGTYMSMKLLLLTTGENHDAVPVVVLRERLAVAALSYDMDTVRRNAIFLGEQFCYAFGTFLTELHVVCCCSGTFVGIAGDGHVALGIIFEPLCHVIYIHHLALRYG